MPVQDYAVHVDWSSIEARLEDPEDDPQITVSLGGNFDSWWIEVASAHTNFGPSASLGALYVEGSADRNSQRYLYLLVYQPWRGVSAIEFRERIELFVAFVNGRANALSVERADDLDEVERLVTDLAAPDARPLVHPPPTADIPLF